MSDNTFETTVTGIKRLVNSRNGNPRYEIATPVGTWKTANDIGDAYKVSANSIEGRQVRLTLDNRKEQRIIGIDVWEGQQAGEWY